MDTIISYILPWLLTPLMLGFILDTLMGDPRWLPHPIRLFGKLIFIGEKHLNSGKNRILKGGILTLTLTGMVFTLLFVALNLLKSYPKFQLIAESILVFFGIANRNLIEECLKVDKVLKKKGVDEARKQLRTIVGRDTEKLSENQVRIATLETLSENLSDGVIAPLFYYAIGGIPLMFAYKMVNTIDSMIGYKNERFKKFGKIAAKTDDILNFIPARLTALLMVVISFNYRGLIFIFKYGNKHSSPNAGYPEAALAGILNCRFGGANYYHEKLVEKPFIGEKDRVILSFDLKKAVIINVAVTFIFVFLMLVLCYLSRN
ncbi:MAG: adenosylcobinamide-phosphate synthase CbiB [Bacteroidales bacterium]